jgi:hypothetical protein
MDISYRRSSRPKPETRAAADGAVTGRGALASGPGRTGRRKPGGRAAWRPLRGARCGAGLGGAGPQPDAEAWPGGRTGAGRGWRRARPEELTWVTWRRIRLGRRGRRRGGIRADPGLAEGQARNGRPAAGFIREPEAAAAVGFRVGVGQPWKAGCSMLIPEITNVAARLLTASASTMDGPAWAHHGLGAAGFLP